MGKNTTNRGTLMIKAHSARLFCAIGYELSPGKGGNRRIALTIDGKTANLRREQARQLRDHLDYLCEMPRIKWQGLVHEYDS